VRKRNTAPRSAPYTPCAGVVREALPLDPHLDQDLALLGGEVVQQGEEVPHPLLVHLLADDEGGVAPDPGRPLLVGVLGHAVGLVLDRRRGDVQQLRHHGLGVLRLREQPQCWRDRAWLPLAPPS